MFLVLSCSFFPIYWSTVLSRGWRYSWSSAGRRCSNYIWVINNFIAYYDATYIRSLSVVIDEFYVVIPKQCWFFQQNIIIWTDIFTLHIFSGNLQYFKKVHVYHKRKSVDNNNRKNFGSLSKPPRVNIHILYQSHCNIIGLPRNS